jgi:prepilin-type N-terminal cleavage/methylation domain-containing protein
MRCSRRGFSIVEVMVASSLFLVVMMIGTGALQVVKRAGDHLKGRSQPRQQLRLLLGHLQRDVRAATFVYDPHLTVNFGGGFSHLYTGIPPVEPAAPAKNEVIYALAETAASEPQYTVVGLFLQPEVRDRAYEGSHRVVMASVAHQNGPTPGSPADIPLAALPVGSAQLRTFATASPADGLRVRRSPSGDGLSFEFVIGHRNEAEKVTLEVYQSQLTMRNNR